MSQLIRDDQKNLIAKYIASKLTIKRRTFLTTLTQDKLSESIPNFQKLFLLFEKTNVHKMKANIDLQILEACILSQNIKEIQENYMKINFAEIFAAIIIKDFMDDVKLKYLDSALE